MVQFEDLSNEVLLCIWDQLSSVDVIYSFSDINIRINSLLLKFHGLHKELDIGYCSLSACRLLCRQVSSLIEWRVGLTNLKLGNLYRCCQIDMFAIEVRKLFVENDFARQGRSSNGLSKDVFRLLMTYSNNVQPIFPHLRSLSIFQSVLISEDCRDTVLYIVGGGSSMRDFTWNTCSNQAHHSRAFFNWLFRCSRHLISYNLETPPCENGFELKYDDTLINDYIPHPTLIRLRINVINLNTLNVLLHYLPQLEHLGNRTTFDGLKAILMIILSKMCMSVAHSQ